MPGGSGISTKYSDRGWVRDLLLRQHSTYLILRTNSKQALRKQKIRKRDFSLTLCTASWMEGHH